MTSSAGAAMITLHDKARSIAPNLWLHCVLPLNVMELVELARVITDTARHQTIHFVDVADLDEAFYWQEAGPNSEYWWIIHQKIQEYYGNAPETEVEEEDDVEFNFT